MASRGVGGPAMVARPILGIDIGGSGIKGALVDVAQGAFLSERLRLPTPSLPGPSRSAARSPIWRSTLPGTVQSAARFPRSSSAALPPLLESRDIFQQRGSRYEMSISRGTLGLLALLQGDLARAYAQLHEAVTIAMDFNFQEMIGFWQPLLGYATLYTGDVVGRAGS